MTSNGKEVSPYRVLADPLPREDVPQVGRLIFADEPVHLRDYWRVLVKYRRLILGILFFVVATAIIVTFTMSPRYTSTAIIEIERQAPKVAPDQDVRQTDPNVDVWDQHDYFQTQYDILKSRTLAANVIKSLGMGSDSRFTGQGESPGFVEWITERFRPWVEGEGSDNTSDNTDEGSTQDLGVSSKLLNRYAKKLSIEPVRNSRLVHISFTSRHPELAAQVANQHVDQYIKRNLERHLGVTANAKEFLESELAKAKNRVNVAEIALNKFRKEKGVISLDNDGSDTVSVRLDDLNKRFTEAQADRIRLQGQYDLIQLRDDESLPDVVSNSLVQQLKGSLTEVRAERAELDKIFTPRYPKMAEVMAREAEINARLNAEVDTIVASIQSAYLAAKNREAAIGRELEEQRQLALKQKDVGAEYEILKRDVDTARSLYTNLLKRLKDVDVAAEIRTSNVSVVDWAQVPTRPSSPKKLLYILVASLVGGLVSVATALFLEYLDNTVRTPEEVERHLHLPTLGVVPSFKLSSMLDVSTYSNGYNGANPRRPVGDFHKGESEQEEVTAEHVNSAELVVHRQPLSVISEAYRTIRTAILLSSAERTPQVLLFTSSISGEGKTTTAVNEAVTLVLTGSRVMMIDADIRKPKLHSIFNVPNAHGLSSCLAGQSNIASSIYEVPLNGKVRRNDDGAHGCPNTDDITGGLFVVPSGPLPPNPAELLGSRRMKDLIEALREQYDYIIFDTPPVLPVTDAVVLATMSDGVVLVIRSQETPVKSAIRSQQRLESARTKILGVVLNDVDVTNGNYEDYKGYRYYSYEQNSDPA